jgi:hypothetical protein
MWPLTKRKKNPINYYLHTRGIYTFIHLHTQTNINRNRCDLLFMFYVPVADVIDRPPALVFKRDQGMDPVCPGNYYRPPCLISLIQSA